MKIMINWKPEGRKKRGRPHRNWKDRIYTAKSERDTYQDRRMEQSKAMDCGSRKASSDVSKLHNIYIYIYKMNGTGNSVWRQFVCHSKSTASWLCMGKFRNDSISSDIYLMFVAAIRHSKFLHALSSPCVLKNYSKSARRCRNAVTFTFPLVESSVKDLKKQFCCIVRQL